MKVITYFFFLLSLTLTSLNAQEDINVIIPKPQLFQPQEGAFILTKKRHYYAATSLATNAIDYLQQQLRLNAGFLISPTQTPPNDGIYYKLNKKLQEEAYTLQVTPHSVIMEANSQSGFFYATVSLMQLMDAKIWSQQMSQAPQNNWTIPACSIEDYPRFKWRGMMLDSSRNFFSVAYVKKFIDRMAQFKLNVFHWHLTDDEGWRIEIKKYPLLTQVGAKRGPGTKLPFSLYPTMRGTKDKIQEGYYTQDDIREIVAYAAKRSVNILPEIDMPAHAKAAVIAYPELLQDTHDKSSYTSVQKVSNNTMDAGLQSTYTFLDNVIKETTALFPFEYIHLGGDEIPKGAWKKSPAVAKLMKKEHLKNTHDVQAYFFTKMDNILAKNDRTMIAWQEVRKHNKALRDDTIIMAWRGNGAGVKAAKNSYKVIMSPAQALYFDQQYVKDKGEYGHTWAGPTNTQEVYRYAPLKNIPHNKQIFVQGVHGALWSERAPTEAIADYLVWPRLLALAEVAWSAKKDRNWKQFYHNRLPNGLQNLKEQNVNYRNSTE